MVGDRVDTRQLCDSHSVSGPRAAAVQGDLCATEKVAGIENYSNSTQKLGFVIGEDRGGRPELL